MVHSVSGVRLAGVAAAVPDRVHTEETLGVNFDPGEVVKLAASTGIRRRHVAGALCASDLCEAAARDLLSSLGWSTADVGGLIVVTQTPDHFLPATACLLHGKIGLRKDAIAFDLNLGCSGYVYGLWVTMNLMASAGIQRALLLAGDTVSRLASPRDRSTAPLFGDAGTATALELTADAPPVCFCLGTDGTGAAHLVVPAGGFRSRPTAQTREPIVREGGNVRSDEDLYMNGAEIFAFSIREVPPLIDTLLTASKWSRESVDYFVLHQANEFMLRFLAKKMKFSGDKMPLSLAEYGNTSSASIPLTLAAALRERLEQGPLRLALAGFGVGLSWGAATLTCGRMVVPRVRLVAEPGAAS
jgi:3-oxoacyl-[acyl-carrier-protein] synthase III